VQHFPQTDGTATLTSVFSGVTAAGTWDLWMIDNFGDPVTVNGWKLILTVNALEVGTTTTVSSSLQPAYTAGPNNSVTFTATVTSGGNPVTAGGTVAFYANGSSSPIACGGGNQTLNSSGQATCATTLTAGSTSQCTSATLPAWPTVCQGNNLIVATYSGSGIYTGSSSPDLDQLVTVHSTNPSGTQWCNNVPFSVPQSATPLAYPSFIGVSGYSNTVANVTVELEGVAGQQAGIPGQFLLVAPDGTHNLDFLDEAFYANGATSAVTLTFFDTAGQTPAGLQPTSGNYEAYDNNPNPQDTFPSSLSPAVDSSVPQVPGAINYAEPRGGTSIVNFGEAFSGAQANGNWSLYTYTSEALTVNGGWCISFTLNNGAVTATSLVSSQPRATTGQPVTFTATVKSSGNPVISGTVTFLDNGLTPAGTSDGDNVVTLNGSGQATFTTSSLAEGDHNIMASYSGVSGTYDPSSNSLYQREDNASTVTNVNSNTVQYCNTGGVTSPQRALGAFSPNPSNIFVSNLFGTINSVSVTLDNFDIPDQDVDIFGLESLLVGPQSALDFFSVTDGTGNVSTGNYTFADSAASALSTSDIAPGTYKPTSDDSSADTFFQDPGNFYALPGSFQYAATHGAATLTSVFGNSNPNGTWSLYFNQTATSTTGATGGWCLNVTENLPVLAISKSHTGNFTQGDTSDTYTIQVTNNGPGPTGGTVTVTEVPPASGLNITGMSGNNWSCSGATCTRSDALNASSSYDPITVTVNVASNAPGSVTNQATVSGGGSAGTQTANDPTTINSHSPGIYSPVSGSTLVGNSATFEWGAFPGATGYWVDIGSTQGGNNYYSSGNLGLVYSTSTSNLPTNGSTIYVTLYAYINGSWSPNAYTYTAFNAGAETAVLTTPPPSSTLAGSTVTFSWNAGTASLQEYWIDVGSSAGGNNYYSSGNLGSATSATASGLPTNGSTVYVTLYTLVSGSWTPNSYTYTAAAQGVLTTPTPSSALTSSTVTFDWTAGSPGPYSYWLDIGSSAGGNNYYSSGNLGNVTTTTVSGLPTNSSTVYVTLYTLISGSWYGNAYTYTAWNGTSGLATMQTPTPGSTLSGTTVTFTWSSDSSATAYWVDIGSSAGGNNIYSSGNLGTATTTTVTTLPANGSTIYVSLYSYVGGQWLNNPFTYTSGP
jgi:hypothetical protein